MVDVVLAWPDFFKEFENHIEDMKQIFSNLPTFGDLTGSLTTDIKSMITYMTNLLDDSKALGTSFEGVGREIDHHLLGGKDFLEALKTTLIDINRIAGHNTAISNSPGGPHFALWASVDDVGTAKTRYACEKVLLSAMSFRLQNGMIGRQNALEIFRDQHTLQIVSQHLSQALSADFREPPIRFCASLEQMLSTHESTQHLHAFLEG